MNSRNFFVELRRRNVYKVAVAYAVVSWLLIQIATQVFPFFEIPHWAIRLVVVLLLFGFPVALILAWAYELTPEGIKRTTEVEPEKSITRRTGRKLNFSVIGVLLVVIVVMAFQRYRPPKPPPEAGAPEKSIAVLPFVDLSQEKDQEYFSDGITEQITNSLARIQDLFVVARTSAFVFRNKPADIRDVGRLLNVRHVLEGSVRRTAGKVRVDARLIDVTNGYNLWSEVYDSSEQDALSLQSDVAEKVASALQIKLKLAESKQLAKLPTQDPEAYDLYLRGRYLLNKRTGESIRKARELFQHAVAKDPRFAMGHSGIADACILLGEYGIISSAEASKLAWPEVSSALAIDNTLAEGHVSRAMLLAHFEWNWPAAEGEYRVAIELNPNNATAHHWYALHLAELGHFDAAVEQITLARKHDPLAPIIRAAKGKILFVARRYDEAINECRSALDLEPNFSPALTVIGQIYVSQGRFREAIETIGRQAERSKDDSSLELAYAYAAAGQKDEAEGIVRKATSSGEVSPYDLAIVCSANHDEAGALRWLETAIERRSLSVVWTRVDPRFDNIRSSVGFRELISRLVPRPPSPI